MKGKGLSIILPTCGIMPDVERIKYLLPEAEIIVIDDFKKKGKGFALIRGSRLATRERIVWLDGDFELPPSQLLDFVLEDSDIVIGSKLHPSSIWENWSIKRRICTIGYYILVKILFGLPTKDTQTGLKVFKRKVLEDILPDVKTTGYAFDVEVLTLARKRGYSIKEMAVIVQCRKATGSASMITILKMLWDTLKIKLRIILNR